jgi:hypothetical protein
MNGTVSSTKEDDQSETLDTDENKDSTKKTD